MPEQNKNTVGGSISNVKGSIIIGDNITVQQANTQLAKELTSNLPTLRQDQIIGRQKDIADIHTKLFDQKQVVLVKGMGGIGKTTVAQVYLTEYYEAYQHIGWISLNAGGDDFESEFINAEGLLNRFNIEKAGKTIRDLFIEIISKLKAVEGAPSLLVIDNASGELGDYYSLLPNQPNWHLLLTSREQIPNFDLKELGFLDKNEAVALFKHYYKRQQLADSFLFELVKDLEYHTLTIEILAKTAHKQRLDPHKLITALQDDLNTDAYVRHKSGKVSKLTSYLISIFNIATLTDKEKWLLVQFACLPPDLHAFDLLQDLLCEKEEDKTALSSTLTSLAEKGWLLYSDNADGYKIHRIIIDVVKRSMGVEEEEVRLLIENISRKLSIDQTKDNPVDKFVWAPFGTAILNNFKEATTERISKLQNNLALVLQDLGDYQGAKKLLEKAMISDENNFGEQHPTTARSYSNLALVLQDLGDYQGAKKLLEKSMISDENNFGEQHPNTARSYSNLALVLQDLGDYQGAKKLLEKAMISAQNNFGEQHPTTAVHYSNLATLIQALGDYQGAKKLLEKAMISAQNNFGEQHPTTAIRYSNLALVLRDLGDYQGAKKLLEKAYKVFETNLGIEHPNSKVVKGNLDYLIDLINKQ